MRVLRGIPALWKGCLLFLVGMVAGSMLTSSFHTCTSSPTDKEFAPLLKLRGALACDCSTCRPANSPPSVSTDFKKLSISPAVNTTYLHPPPSKVKGRDPPQHLNEEYTVKNELTVAVFTNQDHLKMADTVYDTWGESADQIMFFVGEDCDVTVPMATGLPLVKVPGVRDTHVNSVVKMFQVLKYLSDNYLQTSHWFLLASDNVYVRTDKLKGLLERLDPSSLIYLGHSANGRHSDIDKLSLLAHERYCLGSTGVVLSGGLLAALTQHLEACLSGVVSVGGSGGVGEWPDVELGRCVSRMTGVQCAQSAQARDYFVADYSGKAPTLASVEQAQAKFNELISYHPVSESVTMKTLHTYYTRLQFKAALDSAHNQQSAQTIACNALASLGGVAVDDCSNSFCDCPRETGRCPAVGVINDPPKSYQPSTIYDYLSWHYFDDRTLYSDKLVLPSTSLQQQKDSRKELQMMLSKAVQSASERYGRHLKFKRLINGWVRHNPFRGSEYIVDCLFTDTFMRTVQKRVSLVRPLATNYVTLKDNADTQSTVHFIVPLANVNVRFREFMSMYEEIGLQSKENVHLILAVYGSKDIEFVNSVLVEYREKYPKAEFTVVEGKGDFSRGKALHLGMTRLRSDELAFICDVDMAVSQSFIERCRKNTMQGKRVYYPEFFKLYNLDYVYRTGNYPNKVPLKRRHGHWAYYSFGMLCIYKSDYTHVGGMNTNIVGWGEEDVKFFEKVVRKKLDVLRAPDPGLSHRWHEKNCPKTLAKTQYIHCLSSRGENLADRIELANYIYEKNVQLKYTQHGQPHNVQLSFTNDTSDKAYSIDN